MISKTYYFNKALINKRRVYFTLFHLLMNENISKKICQDETIDDETSSQKRCFLVYAHREYVEYTFKLKTYIKICNLM